MTEEEAVEISPAVMNRKKRLGYQGKVTVPRGNASIGKKKGRQRPGTRCRRKRGKKNTSNLGVKGAVLDLTIRRKRENRTSPASLSKKTYKRGKGKKGGEKDPEKGSEQREPIQRGGRE